MKRTQHRSTNDPSRRFEDRAPVRGARPARRLASAVLAVSILVTACGGSDDESDDVTTLSFFSWSDEETMAPIIEEFERQNEDIQIEFSHSPPIEEYVSALQTRLLAGTAADVFMMVSENQSSLIGGEHVVDLSDYDFMSTINEFNRNTYSADGRAYGMSVATWGGGVLYNTALTDSVGMTELPQSWDEFLELFRTLQEAGITPFYEALAVGEVFTFYALTGLEFANDGGDVDERIFSGETTFAETWAAPLERYNQLFEEDLVTRDVVGLGVEQIMEEFVNGRVAMIVTGPWSLPTVYSQNPDMEVSFMPIPGAAGEAFMAGAASPAYAINSATENLEAAERFLEFMASEQGVEMFHQETASLTTTSNFEPEVPPSLEVVFEHVLAGEIYLPMISWPRHEDALRTEMVAKLQEMALGQISERDVAEAMDRKLAELDG